MNSDIPPQDYQAFRKFLEESCGIILGDNKAYLVNSRLKPVMAKHDIPDLGTLVTRLPSASNRQLREEVIDAMTTNETLWFRDTHPFDILKNRVFSGGEAGAISPVRIWSAACSTGQEPYSIAISAKEFQDSNPGKLKGGVKVIASDISSTVLNHAKQGIYESLALGRGLSEQRLKKFFSEVGDGRWQVNQDIRSRIDFHEMNLLDSYQRVGSNLDMIFCRNVLIYFSNDLKKQILTKMHKCLKKGGYLFLGASESLNGMSDLYEMEQCRPGIIYKAR